MPEFNVGDVVRCTDPKLHVLYQKSYLEIMEITTNSKGVFLHIAIEGDRSKTIARFSAKSFEVVEREKRKPGDMLFTTDEVKVTSPGGGSKGVKPLRHDLIPVEPLAELATVYSKGAIKYGDHNWRGGIDFSKSLAALERHLAKFKLGIDYDDETETHHLAAVMFHCCTMMWMQAASKDEFDDRYHS